MKNIKLYASPHLAESVAACPEVWDAEGDSQDLAGRCSSNLRRQNLRRSAKLRRCLAAGCRHPAAPPAAGQGCPAAPPAVPRPSSCSSSPNGIQLRNLCLAVKGLLCRVKHIIERLCSRLWLVLHTSFCVLCLLIVVQHIRYPRIRVIILDTLSHHFLSRTMRFTMKDPPSIARRKSILPNMFYHGLL
jgi:hypothetical protein